MNIDNVNDISDQKGLYDVVFEYWEGLQKHDDLRGDAAQYLEGLRRALKTVGIELDFEECKFSFWASFYAIVIGKSPYWENVASSSRLELLIDYCEYSYINMPCPGEIRSAITRYSWRYKNIPTLKRLLSFMYGGR